MVKMFFKTLRLALMPFTLLWAKLAMPKGIVRSAEAQQQNDVECGQLALYHFKTCPFCIKVRREMGRLSLPIELRDAQHEPEHRDALLQGGGKVQTPCLRITDGQGAFIRLLPAVAVASPPIFYRLGFRSSPAYVC